MQDLRSESIFQTQTPQKSKWKHLNTLNHSFKSVFIQLYKRNCLIILYYKSCYPTYRMNEVPLALSLQIDIESKHIKITFNCSLPKINLTLF